MKKVLCIILVFSILLNVFAVGVFNIRSEAFAFATLGTAVLYVLGGAVVGALSSYIGSQTVQLSDSLREWGNSIVSDANSNALSRGEVIQLVDPGNGNLPYFEPASGLSDYDQKFAKFMCDELNKDENLLQSIANGYKQVETGVGGSSMDAATYSKIKTDATNAAIKFMTAQAKIEGNDALSEVMPSYSFDFVGPIPGITMPTSTGYVQAEMNGYRLYTPAVTTREDCSFSSEAQAKTIGATVCRKVGENPERWHGDMYVSMCYGHGLYSIYGGKMYFWCARLHNSNGYPDEPLQIINFNNGNMIYFMKSADGHSPQDDGCKSWVGVSCGAWICTDPNVTENYPGEFTPNDLIQTTGGETVNINRTDAEDTIGKAISSGIGNENSLIGFDENGNIVSFAGIPIDTLKEALNKIATGENGQSINFDSIEGYLQRIIEILGEINASQAGVQENVNGKTLDEINENVKTLADAMTEAKEIDIDKTYSETDSIVVSHVGLKEATEIATKLGIVKQCQQLFSNILNSDKYSDSAPNFKFYYDSNKDGDYETYTAIDLSFLEQPLSNANLADKRRFQKNMTVREFIQLLMIFICYVGFFLKLIRKLPGLLGAGESTGGDALEIQSLRQQGKL
ncbi:MAG: hypothetical protein IJT87_13350 [Ruminiclostridium sp.]|nr:hypothetical protein [Ruminiclostridium sp.]